MAKVQPPGPDQNPDECADGHAPHVQRTSDEVSEPAEGDPAIDALIRRAIQLVLRLPAGAQRAQMLRFWVEILLYVRRPATRKMASSWAVCKLAASSEVTVQTARATIQSLLVDFVEWVEANLPTLLREGKPLAAGMTRTVLDYELEHGYEPGRYDLRPAVSFEGVERILAEIGEPPIAQMLEALARLANTGNEEANDKKE